MNSLPTILIGFCFIFWNWVFPLFAQGQTRHWTFEEGTDSEILKINTGTDKVAYQRGLSGGSGLDLSASKNNLKLEEKDMDFHDRFTVSFWFKVEDINKRMALLSLVQLERTEEEVKKYLTLGIEAGHCFLEDRDGFRRLAGSSPIKTWEWCQVNLVYEKHNAYLYLKGKAIYTFSQSELILFNDIATLKNELYIGGNPHEKEYDFEGIIDELMIYNEILSEEKIKNEYEKIAEAKPEIALEEEAPQNEIGKDTFRGKDSLELDSLDQDLPEEEAIEEDPFSNEYEAKTKDRENIIVDSFLISSTDFTIEVWDFDEYDKDYIQIYQNNVKHPLANPFTLGIKKNKETFSCNLRGEDEVHLIFYAEDLGELTSGSTIGLRVLEEGQQTGKVLKLKSTDRKNAVIKFVRKRSNKGMVYLKYHNKDNYFSLKLIKSNNKSTKGKLLVQIEGGQEKTFDLNQRVIDFRMNLLPDKENRVYLKTIDIDPDAKYEFSATLFHGVKELGKDKLEFGKHDYIYILNDPIIKERDTIRIPCNADENNKQKLELHIKDDKLADGDRISIRYGGKTILDNYTLTKEVYKVPITIDTDQKNVLLIIAEGFGNREHGRTCTAAINVYYGDEKVKSFDFSLSTDIDRKNLWLICED